MSDNKERSTMYGWKIIVISVLLVIFVLLSGTFLVRSARAAQEPALFVPLAGDDRLRATVEGRAATRRGVLRSQAVRLNYQALPGVDASSSAQLVPQEQTLQLNLFPDVTLTAVLRHAERLSNGITWVGKVVDQDMSNIVLVVQNGILAGSIVSPQAAYTVRYSVEQDVP